MKEQYWISPQGEVIAVEEHPVKTMIKDAAKFGYTIDEMQMLYAKYSDLNQEEGEATKTIIEGLVEKGWAYCFHKNEQQDWRIEVNRLDKHTRYNLKQWAAYMLDKKLIDMDTNVRYYRHVKKDRVKKSIRQLIDDELFM